jgi:hypothetical protein
MRAFSFPINIDAVPATSCIAQIVQHYMRTAMPACFNMAFAITWDVIVVATGNLAPLIGLIQY